MLMISPGRTSAVGPPEAAYRELLKEFAGITALAHGEMFELTDRPACEREEI